MVTFSLLMKTITFV